MPEHRTSRARTRLMAIIRKETFQMTRDKSTLTLGIFLPILLLLLFGFGLSLDVNLIPITVVREDSSPVTRDLYITLSFSHYFQPRMVNSMHEAEKLLQQGDTDAIVRRKVGSRVDAVEHIQIIVNGRDANRARIVQRYIEGAVTLWSASRPAGASSSFDTRTVNAPVGQAVTESRVWYNHALESRYFLVPGVIVLIMSIIGALLTALIMAREWERGTFEALIATPATEGEILVGKTVPYFVLGMIGLSLCLAASVWIFRVPIRGSWLLIISGSAIYLLVALGIGLLVSSTVKSQFLASQIVLVISFLPTLMLSGFIFDLRSAPVFVYYFAHIFPSTWYVDLLQTLFLVGNIPKIVGLDFAVMVVFAVIMLGLARKATRKSLE